MANLPLLWLCTHILNLFLHCSLTAEKSLGQECEERTPGAFTEVFQDKEAVTNCLEMCNYVSKWSKLSARRRNLGSSNKYFFAWKSYFWLDFRNVLLPNGWSVPAIFVKDEKSFPTTVTPTSPWANISHIF